MAGIFVKAAQTTPGSVSNTKETQLRGLLDGTVITMDQYQAYVAEGIVHGAQTGTGTTPDTLNPVYGDALQDFYLYIPAGTVIMPLQISIALEDTGTALAMDVLAAYSSNGDSAVTGTALTVYNYKTLASPSTNCTATAVVTSGGTTHEGGTDFLEFWRPYAGFGEDAFNGSTAHTGGGQYAPGGAHWSAKQFPAPLIGDSGTACALSIFAGTQAGIGFITVIWAEFTAARQP